MKWPQHYVAAFVVTLLAGKGKGKGKGPFIFTGELEVVDGKCSNIQLQDFSLLFWSSNF